jgi:tetratricopeptide (TPR) repeat protein
MDVRRRWAVLVLAMGAGCAGVGAQTQQQAPVQPKPAQEANKFPGDNTDAPVIPTDLGASAPAADEAIDYGKVALEDANVDPVRSPDDAAPEPSAAAGRSSSSSAGIDQLIQAPPEPKRRHHKDDDEDAAAQPTKQSGPADDEQVGAYYLQTKNWKGALSRFESALVLDPENPDVYWGLGEAQRHLGRFAEAKANYTKLVEYDPDSKHGKEAKRLLKTPELENASTATVPAAQP